MLERKALPDQAYLETRFIVQEGRLVWRSKPNSSKEDRRWNTRYAGKVAGSVYKTGYSHVKLDGVVYLEHRLCFKLYHGYCPDLIDHADGNKLNNEQSNLLDSNYLANNNNRHILGLSGIYEKNGIFEWVVNYNREVFSQAGFKTREEAAVARAIAKQQIIQNTYQKQEKKRIDNSTGLSCVFRATREKTFFFKFVFNKKVHCKYGFTNPETCAIALEKRRILIMGEAYKAANITIYIKHKEEILCQED